MHGQADITTTMKWQCDKPKCFYRASAFVQACDIDIAFPSVRLSVGLSHAGIVSKRLKMLVEIFPPSDSSMIILVLSPVITVTNSDGVTPDECFK